MAVKETPLGFQEPDGDDPIRNGDNLIAANARKSEAEHQSARGRLGAIEAKNTEQDGRLGAVESKNSAQDGRLTSSENAADTLKTRVTAVESKNAAQDATLTYHGTSITATNDSATALAGRVSATENINGTQNGRLNAIEGNATTLAARVTATESKNAAQDTDIATARTNATADATAAAKTYTDTQDATYRTEDRVLWRSEDDGHQAAAEANAKTYTDEQVATDRGRLTAIESKNTTQDGRLTSAESEIAAVPAQTSATIEVFAATDSRALQDVETTGWPIPFTDKDGYMAGAFDATGKLNLFKAPVLPAGALPIESLDPAMGWRTLDPNTGYVFGMVDLDGYMAAGLSTDGQFTIFKGATAGSPSVSSRTKILCTGDSLTRGYTGGVAWDVSEAYPAKLAALLPGVEVVNQGFGGNPVDEIRLRVAAVKLYLSPVGGSIPASGPVDVTTRQAIGWVPGNTVSINGTLSGVYGTFTRTPTGMTFTRSASGTAVTITTPAPLVINKTDYSGYTALIWTGRNDVSYGCLGHEKTVPDHVVASNVDFIEWLSPHVRQFGIVGIVNRVDEPRGTAKYNQVIEINDRLAALYPGKYIDVRRYLIDQAIYDAGITPTQADLDSMANDAPPPSIMDGGSHYNKPIAPLLAQNVFYSYLTEKGLI